MGDKQGAVADSNEALRINPNESRRLLKPGRYPLSFRRHAKCFSRLHRSAGESILTKAGAYLRRGLTRAEGGDKPGALQDFQKAADLFQQQGDKDNYERALNYLRELQ